ncbi:hypothetical protein CIPAW_16G003800 [Carya illinoinensis]|uniref:Amino acid transporter transmembrane domain-containing protein n=1 Tax=Carya illinoinensis TaxID=32201 RepID=A0A8T1N554_CARIL|nr:hypothetical protein CIPAW_16G003800 [Carya illinoinensis]
MEVPSEDKWVEDDTSRRAKWWYSTFHTVTAMIGAGVLSLPYAMAYLGWGPGTMVLVLSWCMTLNTLWQMIQLHECVPGTRFDRYIDLGRLAFGPKLGPWIVLPQQLIVQVGCDIVYMVTGEKCLKKFMEMACTNCTQLRQSYWILILGPSIFSSLSFPILILLSSTSTVGCLARGRIDNVSYAYKTTSSADYMFRVFNALGQITFAFAGHAVALEIQATIPSTPEKPSKIPMWKGAIGAYFVNAICYFPVAMIGYWVFGQDVDDNVYAMQPVFSLPERIMMKRLNFLPGIALRLVARSSYVAFTLLVGVTFPFFGDLIGFFGGFGFAPTSYFLPSIMWLVIKKPKRFIFIMLASTIGGFRNIVVDASTYSFYT